MTTLVAQDTKWNGQLHRPVIGCRLDGRKPFVVPGIIDPAEVTGTPAHGLSVDQRIRLDIGRIDGKVKGIGPFIDRVKQDRKCIPFPKTKIVPLKTFYDVFIRSITDSSDVKVLIVIGKPDLGLDILRSPLVVHRKTHPEIIRFVRILPGSFIKRPIDADGVITAFDF